MSRVLSVLFVGLVCGCVGSSVEEPVASARDARAETRYCRTSSEIYLLSSEDYNGTPNASYEVMLPYPVGQQAHDFVQIDWVLAPSPSAEQLGIYSQSLSRRWDAPVSYTFVAPRLLRVGVRIDVNVGLPSEHYVTEAGAETDAATAMLDGRGHGVFNASDLHDPFPNGCPDTLIRASRDGEDRVSHLVWQGYRLADYMSPDGTPFRHIDQRRCVYTIVIGAEWSPDTCSGRNPRIDATGTDLGPPAAVEYE